MKVLSSADNRFDEWVDISFEGRSLRVQKGRSLATALLAHDVLVLGRSFKFHRPRGYYCGHGYCNNCALTVNGLPNVLSCEHKIRGGEIVSRERGWPSARYDALAVLGLFKRWLRPGFQERLFPRHPFLAKTALKVVGKMAGAGRLPTQASAMAEIRASVTCQADVLVIGGGLSGCLAALGAARAGAKVMLVQRDALGGRSLLDNTPISVRDTVLPVRDYAHSVVHEVREDKAIRIVNGTALGCFEDRTVPILTDKQLLACQVDRVVVASGTYDSPGLFEGNDKPNVILADGVMRLVLEQNLVPWRRALVLTDCARGYALAALLQQQGVEVALIVDQSDPANRDSEHSQEIARASNYVQGRIRSVAGFSRVRRIKVDTAHGSVQLRADLLCVALKPHPANAMERQWRQLHQDHEADIFNGIAVHKSISSKSVLALVGSAAGWPDRQMTPAAFDVGRNIASSDIWEQ